MTSSQRLSWVLAWVLVAAAWAPASPGQAQQDRLDPAMVSNANQWTPDERSRVEAFVERHVEGLLSGDDARLSTAREAMVGPFTTAGSTPRFKSQFSEVIAAKLTPALEAEALIPRINAMIIATHLTHASALGPIRQSLADPNPGVRYPAAKAIANLLSGEALNTTQRREALALLEDLIDSEDDPYVVQPLLAAMSQAGDHGRVLVALNRRVDWHIFRADQGYDPEAEALQTLFSQMFVAPQRNADDVKQLARASARYMLLAAEQLDEGAVPAQNDRSHFDIIKRASSYLQFAANELKTRERIPDDPNRFIIQRNTGELVRIARAWIDLLKKEPFGFTDAQLSTTEADAPAAQ